MPLEETLQKEISVLTNEELIEKWEEMKKTKNLLTIMEELMSNRFLDLLGEDEEIEISKRKIRKVVGMRYNYAPETIYTIVGDTDLFVRLVKVDNKAIDKLLKDDETLDNQQKGRIKRAKVGTPTRPFVRVI